MASGYGSNNCNKAENEQSPMCALYKGKGFFGILFSVFFKKAVQDVRFKNEDNDGKNEPYDRHSVNPPITDVQIPRPAIKQVEHVKPGDAGNSYRNFCLER